MNKVLKFVGEIVAIVIGITLSFIVEEWREEWQKDEIYRSYLQKIDLDLTNDSLMFSITTEVRKVQYESALGLYREIFLNEPMAIADSTFVKDLAYVFRNSEISLNGPTYAELQSSGNLRLVKSDTIRNMMLYYYEHPSIETWNKTLPERNLKALGIVVNNLPLSLSLPEDSLVISDWDMDYQSLRQQVKEKLQKDKEFEGLFKNSIRTLQYFYHLEQDLFFMNSLFRNTIRRELE